jgi:hypothetical protein
MVELDVLDRHLSFLAGDLQKAHHGASRVENELHPGVEQAQRITIDAATGDQKRDGEGRTRKASFA